jgi:serine/threonine protein phosphatase PrpC
LDDAAAVMGVAEKWRSGAVTHPGRMRAENQDRNYLDDTLGIFLVVDGLGGHAAGEKAAETAVEVIRAELASVGESAANGDARHRIQNAIVAANNRICELADENEDCRGMACVLTLAMLAGDRVVVGHVGDSRLYLIWNGAIRKLTADHSPVGEREDRGELTELEAMQHPRRHEVFRDVGSRRRTLDDDEFVEMKEFLFKPDAAVLLCSDGLSDLITSAQMMEIIEHYDGDAEKVAAQLVDAANAAGGKDNVTAMFVAGSEFLGADSAEMAGARKRHSITRARAAAVPEAAPGVLGKIARLLTSRVAFLVYGFVIGVVLALAWRSP